MTSKLPRENITGVLGSQVDILNPRDSFPYRASILRTLPASGTAITAITVPAGDNWLVHVDCSADSVQFSIYEGPTFTGGTNVPIYHTDFSKSGLPTNTLLKDITVSADGTKKFDGAKDYTILLTGGKTYLVRLTNAVAANVDIITDVMIRT